MATNLDIITRAFRLAGILSESESPSSYQANQALDLMNDLLLDWGRDGIELEYYPQDELTATFPVAEDYFRAVKFGLANEILAEYGVPIPPKFEERAADSYASLVRESVEIEEADVSFLPGTRRYIY